MAEPLTAENNSPEAPSTKPFPRIIGQSKPLLEVFQIVEKVCDTNTTVLIQGESGTGKELIAQALHYRSERRDAPFVPVNCGAIPGELLESELFGHEKGAFTHAVRTRLGRFELAHGGTVFLDEIAEMSPMLQVKLLRVLQEKQFERIGGTKTITSDFRVIAATNRDLEEEVANGGFREDLYYRLTVVPIQAPPLRTRSSDIPLLVESFIEKFNSSKKRSIKGISDEAMNFLLHYSWPGNVRELENVIERMVILALDDDTLTVDDLPQRILDPEHRVDHTGEIPAQGLCLSEEVAEFEKRLIIQALDQTDWVKNRAANLLQVNRTTLLEKMKRYGIVKGN
ncbi:MAG: sigma-54 dependent transcriptional regulator [Desulfobulbaceae bacterium]|nr:sigma-54 dependent transcriptional regulator [Desulfobulbaceae bacterium]